MKISNVTCHNCNKDFHRPTKEVRRSIKLNRRMFCSRKCLGAASSKNLGVFLGRPKIENLKSNNVLDNYSSFRHPLRKVRERMKKKGWGSTDLTLPYLEELWNIQEGICPLSGIKMYLPKSTTEWDSSLTGPYWASLDRTDSNKGYVVGNVRFICYMANIAKNKFLDSDLIEFCKAVSNHKESD